LVSRPTPSPWSARQIHVWSISTSSLLTTTEPVARPGPAAPPTRMNTSCIAEAGLPRAESAVPQEAGGVVPVVPNTWNSHRE
jgi:hypothetical protein